MPSESWSADAARKTLGGATARPTKLITIVHALAIADVVLHFLITTAAGAIADRGGSELALVLPLLIVDGVVPPVLMLILVYALVRALADLRRLPERRTPLNVGTTMLGVVTLPIGVGLWYDRMASFF